MPTPLPFLPTSSPQAGVTRSTEWVALVIGLALGAILAAVCVAAGACGGWLAWRRSDARARARAARQGERPRPYQSYFDFMAGVDSDHGESARASTAMGGQHDHSRGRPSSATTVTPTSPIAEQMHVGERRRPLRFLDRLAAATRRRSWPEEMEYRQSLELTPLRIHVDVATETDKKTSTCTAAQTPDL
ncbi:hypothetical protein AURDEDRAFT_119248 [Auricularia subglabra TFB-10046 SS5]|nr:hypothetical protein AURDEDRAFT_119248 [Auricularia subglabra TFB-10046 SS5]